MHVTPAICAQDGTPLGTPAMRAGFEGKSSEPRRNTMLWRRSGAERSWTGGLLASGTTSVENRSPRALAASPRPLARTKRNDFPFKGAGRGRRTPP